MIGEGVQNRSFQLFTIAQCLFRSLLLINIHTRADITGKRAIRVNSWYTNVENPPKFSVISPEPILHPEGLAALKSLGIGFKAPLEIVRVDSFHPAVPKLG